MKILVPLYFRLTEVLDNIETMLEFITCTLCMVYTILFHCPTVTVCRLVLRTVEFTICNNYTCSVKTSQILRGMQLQWSTAYGSTLLLITVYDCN